MENRGSAVLSLGQLFAPFGEHQPNAEAALAPAWREDAEEEEEEEEATAAAEENQQQPRDCTAAAAREKDEEALLERRRRHGRSFSLPDSPSLAAARFLQRRRLPGESDGSEDDEEDGAASPTGGLRGCCTKCKKRVQFADSLGLCLASVKHYSAAEEPQVPHAVLSRLQSFPMRHRDFEDFTAALAELGSCASASSFPRPPPQVPLQLAPPLDGADKQNGAERLQRDRVCLEEVTGAALAGAPTDVRGVVRVLSCPGSKEVTVRYTFNEWLSFLDVPALPLPDGDPSDGSAPVERYQFSLCLPPGLPDGTAVHFAICYRSQQGEHWDNNGGANYTLRDCSSEKSATPL
ncbi:protein phosphatase 1 regulatory subunit 3G [Ahaetulla prasina]|uniref:protein phosphatase 1 regulatory subunit 3G n=1 Tax=Ahaetulla prasina TaxID=499056 RepID=UPI00264A3A9B|nr:protein phosphatase 1 regulatory subunit 3G [Ahaetulla prasina]